VLTSHLLRDGGTWQQFMTTHDRGTSRRRYASAWALLLAMCTALTAR
jgi:hypothetical protein